MRHFSIFESNAYPPQNLIVGRIIERHPKKIQNGTFTGFFGAWIVYRRVKFPTKVNCLTRVIERINLALYLEIGTSYISLKTLNLVKLYLNLDR